MSFFGNDDPKTEVSELEMAAFRSAITNTLDLPDMGPIMNGALTEALGMSTFGGGFPQNQGSLWTEPVSNTTSLFKNLRWYFVSNFRQLLSEMYVEIGLVQTIIDTPVDDALRGGITIKSKQLEEEEIEQLQISLDRDADLITVGWGGKWNRLFGGAGIMILTDQDPEEPFDLDSITAESRLEFRAADLWELTWSTQNTEGYDPSIQVEQFEFYDYYGKKIHKTRVMRLKGQEAPSFVRPRLRGWGTSEVERLVRSLNQYYKATDLGYELLDEFKVDVYKLKDLATSLASPQGQEKVRRRIQIANRQKNYQNAIVLDSLDDWDHKQLNLAGLDTAMQGIRMQVASDMRMPMLKLFGTPATGLNASDESSLEVYNSMVESQVRDKLKYDILRICEIKCQKLFGYVPDDLSIEFKPLRVLSAEQEQNVKNSKFNRLQAAADSGRVTTFEYREAMNKGNLLDITLDNSGEVLNPDDPDVGDMVAEGDQSKDGDSSDIDDPGANRKDTRGVRAWEKDGLPKGNISKNENEFKESDHPRDDSGKFGSGGGGGGGSGKAEIKAGGYVKIAGRAGKSLFGGATGRVVRVSRDGSSVFVKIAGKKEPQMFDIAKVDAYDDDDDDEDNSLENSAGFDLASYEADGGDAQMDTRRVALFDEPLAPWIDKGIWEQAKQKSRAAYGGTENRKLTVWLYAKLGGRKL